MSPLYLHKERVLLHGAHRVTPPRFCSSPERTNKTLALERDFSWLSWFFGRFSYMYLVCVNLQIHQLDAAKSYTLFLLKCSRLFWYFCIQSAFNMKIIILPLMVYQCRVVRLLALSLSTWIWVVVHSLYSIYQNYDYLGISNQQACFIQ